MKINEIIKHLENIYDKNLAYDFDNPGLNVGSFNKELTGIIVCLDVTDDVIKCAIENKINFIISHHPMIFDEIKNINDNSTVGKKIIKLIKNDISIYSMHTNFDVKNKIGMSDILINVLFKTKEIKKSFYIEKIDSKNGLGKIIYLSKKISIDDMIEKLKDKLNIDKLRIYTKNKYNQKTINKIAILPGSGKSVVDSIINEKVDMYITGDLMHNNILDLMDNDVSYIDCTHYGLEKIFIDYMYNYLTKKYHKCKIIKVYNEYI